MKIGKGGKKTLPMGNSGDGYLGSRATTVAMMQTR